MPKDSRHIGVGLYTRTTASPMRFIYPGCKRGAWGGGRTWSRSPGCRKRTLEVKHSSTMELVSAPPACSPTPYAVRRP